MLLPQLSQKLLSKNTLVVLLFFCATLQGWELEAQDLILKDMTVTAEETFTTLNSMNSIVAGPNFIIGSSGKVTFGYGDKVKIIGEFAVAAGGELYLVSGLLTSVSSSEDNTPVPTEFNVHQNYPNPFNPTTTIAYELPQAEHVEIVVFSISGQKVKTLVSDDQQSGYHSAIWDGTNSTGMSVSSGVYYYKVTAGANIVSGKMTLLK